MKLRSNIWLVTAALATGLLTFADRAPGVAKAVLGVGRHVNQAVERQVGIDWISRSDLPFEGDTTGHFVMWVTLTLIAAAALRTWPLPLLLATIAAMALGSELLQGIITSTREISMSDFSANILGVTLAGAWLWTRDRRQLHLSPEVSSCRQGSE